MMKAQLAVSVLMSCLLSTNAQAQRTWIVDASGGAGHDFTDLPPALAAANHGDKIMVRPGSYQGATTDRGVTVVGDNAQLTSTLPQSPLRVIGLKPGRTFVLSGFSIDAGMLVCADNAGRFHLDRIDARGFTYGGRSFPALEVLRCSAMTATQCRFTRGPVRVAHSSITLTDCELTGGAAQSFGKYGFAGSSALIADHSTLVIARCRTLGGAGVATMYQCIAPFVAASLTNCDSVLSGDGNDSCSAGAACSAQGADAIVLSGGTLLVDPTLRIFATGNGQAIGGNGLVTTRRIPALRARSAAQGGRIDTQLYAPTGEVAALLIDLPRAPAATAQGVLWLDPARLVLADVGPVTFPGYRAVALSIPSVAPLRGVTLALQSASADLSRGRVELTNPAVVALN